MEDMSGVGGDSEVYMLFPPFDFILPATCVVFVSGGCYLTAAATDCAAVRSITSLVLIEKRRSLHALPSP